MSDQAPKYGIEDFAKLIGVSAATARVQLRNAQMGKKHGRGYGWGSQDEMKKDADKLRSGTPKRQAGAGRKPAADKGATKAKGGSGKKAATKKATPRKVGAGKKAQPETATAA